MKKEAPLVENFSHYEIRGLVKIEAWDGSIGFIRMKPIQVFSSQNIDLEVHQKCIQFINDAGFGCKEKLAAVIDVWKVYEFGGKFHWYSDSFDLLNPDNKLSEEEVNQFISQSYDYED